MGGRFFPTRMGGSTGCVLEHRPEFYLSIEDSICDHKVWHLAILEEKKMRRIHKESQIYIYILYRDNSSYVKVVREVLTQVHGIIHLESFHGCGRLRPTIYATATALEAIQFSDQQIGNTRQTTPHQFFSTSSE